MKKYDMQWNDVSQYLIDVHTDFCSVHTQMEINSSTRAMEFAFQDS